MAYAFVQRIDAGAGSPSPNPQTAIFPGNITAGSVIVLFIDWTPATGSITSITDTLGNTYNLVKLIQAQGQSAAIYWARNSAAGANTVTVTFNAAQNFVDVSALEFSGFGAATAAVDKTNSNSAASGNGTTGTIATTIANELLVALEISTGTPGTVSAGWTEVGTFNSNDTGYQIVTATGTYSAAWTGTVGAWITLIASFMDNVFTTVRPNLIASSSGILVTGSRAVDRAMASRF